MYDIKKHSKRMGIGLFLVIFPIFLFLSWKSVLFNKTFFTFTISKEEKFWKKESAYILNLLNSPLGFNYNLDEDRDLIIIDTTGKTIFQFGNRFYFNGDSLKHLNKPCFIKTPQGFFACFPFNNHTTTGTRAFGISAIYYSFLDENTIFKNSPAQRFKFLGKIVISDAPLPDSIKITIKDYYNACYVIFQNPFEEKELFLLLFSLSILIGLTLLTELWINCLGKFKIIFLTLYPWLLIFINHLIFVLYEYEGVEFNGRYILCLKFINLSYYELFNQILIIIFYVFHQKYNKYRISNNIKLNILELVNYYLLLLFIIYIFKDIVSDYDFIRHLSYYLSGKFALINHLLIASLIVASLAISSSLYYNINKDKKLFIFSLTFSGLLIIWFIIEYEIIAIIALTLLLAFSLILKIQNIKLKETKVGLPFLFFAGIILSVLASIQIFYAMQKHEKHRRFLLLSRLESIEVGDPILMNDFFEIANKVRKDTVLINNYFDNQIKEADSLFISKYITGNWKQFSVSLTFCTTQDKIRISPSMNEYNCYDYFKGISGLADNIFDSAQFFVPIEQGNNVKGYLGCIKLLTDNRKTKSAAIFIEFSYTNFSPSFCFADIFYNKGIWNASETIGYSFARYRSGQLISYSGSAWFPDRLVSLHDFKETMAEFTKNQTQYTYLTNNQTQTTLIIARSENILVKFIGISSVIIFLTLILGLLYYLIITYDLKHIKELILLLRVRLQIGILGIVTLVLVVMSLILNDFYVNSLFQWTQRDIKDKVHSLSLEMDAKLQKDFEILNDFNLLSQWLLKLSNIYFLDIIYFNIDGQMQFSTIPQATDKRYYNGHLHQRAYQKIIVEGLPYFMHEEKIGGFTYYAVYFPVRNGRNIYGIGCTPVVAGKPELDNEYRFYTSMMAGLILIIVLVAISFAFLLSGFVVKPLKLLSENISRLRIGMRNEKIEVIRQDEIGQLSQMYNRLVDELESAILELRRKERELAWKDVAKQIAHEIKNPLTPIKLQLQFLESNFKPNDQHWEERFKVFSHTLLEKIEELTRLANTFSELAQWPASKPELVDIVGVIKSNTYLALTDFNGKLLFDLPEAPVWIKIDKYQIGRMIENLVKNARQAIKNESEGIIKISILISQEYVTITIQDNGVGIAPEQRERIFMPNFTTKAFGTGLGLFISRNIVINHGGEIDFSSEPGKGTVFTIRLPKS
ncbi:MAG: two-component system, NtrC family, nitrogen regulation sensor histidine kinase NtrY [Bacteroidales bacterium]|nr:two-component system, NtrC family, nitrogen regulation sensor histidine kinase NtrY [Bacteroidales bacterium]